MNAGTISGIVDQVAPFRGAPMNMLIKARLDLEVASEKTMV